MTLIELLVVTILGILATLFVGIAGKMQARADRAVATSNYRQIGIAVARFAAEHNATLPGPLVMGQKATYKPNDTRQLATQLGIYLGVTDPLTPQTLKIFIPPAYRRDANQLSLDQARFYLANNAADVDGDLSKVPSLPPDLPKAKNRIADGLSNPVRSSEILASTSIIA